MLEQIYLLPVLLFSVILHEISHGWMALKLGDPTARDAGRLTFNPVPHIDPIGSLLIPALSLASSGQVFIAWAKPVPVNPANFARLRRDDILVSVVGPLSNLVLACFFTLASIAVGIATSGVRADGGLADEGSRFLLKMCYGGIPLNIMLAIFNLLPVPPLDGSHILASLLPPRLGMHYRRIGFLGIFAVILLMRWEPFESAFFGAIRALALPLFALVHRFA